MNYKLWLIFLGKCACLGMRFCVLVCVLTAARGGNSQLSVREVSRTIRSLCNWEHERKCEKGWRAKRTLSDIFERKCICVCLGGGVELMSPLTHPWLLSSTSLPLFTAVSFGLESQPWVSMNNENNQCSSPRHPPPLSPLTHFLSNRMLWIRHQRWVKGTWWLLNLIKNH